MRAIWKTCTIKAGGDYLGEGPIVPDVTMVREAVVHIAQLVLLHVLLDRVQGLPGADLKESNVSTSKLFAVLQLNINGNQSQRLASILALVHRGISTTMLSTDLSSVAYSGIS